MLGVEETRKHENSMFFASTSTIITSEFHFSATLNLIDNRQNRLRFVYTHFKSCDQSLDKISFDFSNIFHVMQRRAMNAKSSIIPKLPMGMVI